MTGRDAVGTPMRTVVSAAAGEVPVTLALHAVTHAANDTAARGGV
jgi:hypothetical protein